MSIQSLRADIEGARTHARLDDLSRSIWQGLDYRDDAAARQVQVLAETIQARKAALSAEAAGPMKLLGTALQVRRSIFKPRKHQASPDRAKSLERRRKLALSGPMPPSLAAGFTNGQLAVLGAVANEVMQSQGPCTLCVEAIAAVAGVSRRLAQTALRLAEGDGLLSIEERPRKGQPHDTNCIRIVNKDWYGWAEHRHRNALKKREAEAAGEVGTGGGCREVRPSNIPGTVLRPKRPDGTRIRAAEGERARPAGLDRSRLRLAETGESGGNAMRLGHAAVRRDEHRHGKEAEPWVA